MSALDDAIAKVEAEDRARESGPPTCFDCNAALVDIRTAGRRRSEVGHRPVWWCPICETTVDTFA